MDLQYLTVDSTTARKAFLEYKRSVEELTAKELVTYDERRAALLRRQRETDEAIMRGYRVLSHSRRVIELRSTIQAAGQDAANLPKLAIARADRERVAVIRDRDGGLSFGRTSQRSDHKDPRTATIIRLAAGTLPRSDRVNAWGISATAVVPVIPPRFRPAQLDRYHILFEPVWEHAPKPDPVLLRALGSGLYAVLAVWDLTPLEAAVLEVR